MMKGLKFLSVLAFAMMIVIAFSCANQEKAKNAEAEEENVEESAVETKSDSTVIEVLTDIVAKAKAEGANWSVDEWKDAYIKMSIAIKPIMEDAKSLSQSVNENNAVEVMEKLEKFQKDYAPVEELMDAFTQIARSTENGLAVDNDKEFNDQLEEQYGLPEL